MDNSRFVKFEEYKQLGGEMDETTFNRMKNTLWTSEQYRAAFKGLHKEMRNLGENILSDNYQVEIYAKLSITNPGESSLWKSLEMNLVQGKK